MQHIERHSMMASGVVLGHTLTEMGAGFHRSLTLFELFKLMWGYVNINYMNLYDIYIRMTIHVELINLVCTYIHRLFPVLRETSLVSWSGCKSSYIQLPHSKFGEASAWSFAARVLSGCAWMDKALWIDRTCADRALHSNIIYGQQKLLSLNVMTNEDNCPK